MVSDVLFYSAVGRNDGVVYPNPDGTFIKEMYVCMHIEKYFRCGGTGSYITCKLF